MVGSSAPEKPADGKEPYIKLLFAMPASPVTIRCMCEAAVGRYLHWQGRGKLCPSQERECKCGPMAGPRKWYAHIIGRDVADDHRAVLQVPYTSWMRWRNVIGESLPEMLAINKRYTLKRINDNHRSSCLLFGDSVTRVGEAKGLKPETAEHWVEVAYARIENKRRSEGSGM